MNDSSSDETHELESIDSKITDEVIEEASDEIILEEAPTGRRKRMKRRELIEYDDGNTYLIVNVVKKFKTRVWQRPSKTVETFEYLLYEQGLVHKKLAKKAEFIPVAGENSIRVCSRLHWMQHGPAQLGVLAIALFATGAWLWTTAQLSNVEALWLMLAWLGVMIGCGTAYLRVWIPWAYHYLIVTNVRIMLVYKPPFGLPGTMASLKIGDILNVETVDQSPGRFIPSLGNLLPNFGLTGYKILKGDGAAQGDDWFRNGIKYVRNAEEVENIITSAQAEAAVVVNERHTEDMDHQVQHTALLTEILGVLKGNDIR
jgi:hypothetical protein